MTSLITTSFLYLSNTGKGYQTVPMKCCKTTVLYTSFEKNIFRVYAILIIDCRCSSLEHCSAVNAYPSNSFRSLYTAISCPLRIIMPIDILYLVEDYAF